MTNSNIPENLTWKIPLVLSYYQNLLDNPASARQLGKSRLAKLIMEAKIDWHRRKSDTPTAWVSTEGHCDALDVDPSELYPIVVKAFGDVEYKPELVVDENNAGIKAKPTKVFYYTEEDLELLSEKFKANLVAVTLTDNDKN